MPITREEAFRNVGAYHLSFILSGKRHSTDPGPCPIYCRRCGGTFTKKSVSRLICINRKKRGCKNGCNFNVHKGYLIDLYNQVIVSLSNKELEDKEEIINNHALLFAGSITATTAATATPLVITVLIQDAVTEEAKEELEGKIFSKVEISNLTLKNLEVSWKKDKVKLSSQISKAQNKSVALSIVLQNKTETSPSRLFLEILEKKERKKKLIEEKKERFKEITNSLKNADHLPPQPQRIRSQEDDPLLIQESVLSLTRQPRIIRKDDLELIYIKGIQRQPIWVVKKCLSNLGIRNFYIRNVSFLGKDICELTVLKRSKPMIINILENSFKVLENFNPVAFSTLRISSSTANDEDILRVEKACYRIIS
ncbi:hypothetical protein LY90DRAFT_513536 [Neocallimastix californiae]|uniref:Uncharacterized protein n=1 Tax=Neocallimastix californiae TaxID=1754190 RepID=A0A1Y2AX42_9FUNG|nr:hypothetical protein LY90DRAFT_513536 [Neocallimastix californiae]|eukprot:ORY27149.1 hypothetical protein LY90DRAFT_513536 [Neocallimastix californiae]